MILKTVIRAIAARRCEIDYDKFIKIQPLYVLFLLTFRLLCSLYRKKTSTAQSEAGVEKNTAGTLRTMIKNAAKRNIFFNTLVHR